MHVYHIVLLVLFGYTSHVSGFINDPFVSTTLPTFSTATKRPTTTGSHQGPSNPGEIPPGIQDQLNKMQADLGRLSKENAALKLQVTSLENDVSTLIQLQGRVRQLEQESITTSREISAIQSSGSITTRVEALETSQPQMRSDISRLKLQIGSSSRAFNSAMQNIQTSLDGVKQTVDKLVAAGGVVTNNPGGQVPPHTSGTATLSPPSHTTPFTQILHDCLDVYEKDQYPGVFTIQPPQSQRPFKVYCDSGWAVIQRRTNGAMSFSTPFRRWADYVGGFGNASSDYWLGNDNVYDILAREPYALRVEGVGYSGKIYWAQYNHFTIEDETNYYRLNVSGYSGNYRDTLVTANGNAFVTQDHPGNVSFYRDCSGFFGGGWWANTTTSVPNCGYNLNGRYLPSGGTCMTFADICVKSSIMKIIPSNALT